MSEAADPATCAHAEWNPFPGWMGHYVCANCHILGYKGIVTARTSENDDSVRDRSIKPSLTNKKTATKIVPYLCTHRFTKNGVQSDPCGGFVKVRGGKCEKHGGK